MAFLGLTVNNLGSTVSKRVGTAAMEVGKAGKYMGGAAVDTWKHVDTFGQEAGKIIANKASQSKEWVAEHPGATAKIAGCLAAAPVAIAATPLVLGAAGFTAGGIAAGSAAAGIQAGIGNVAAGSLFATLTSAGAGGAGLAVVNGVVGGTAAAVAIGVTAPGLVKAAASGEEQVIGQKNEDEVSLLEGADADNATAPVDSKKEGPEAKL